MATYEQAVEALKRADAAGNVEDAKKLAQLARSLKPAEVSQQAQGPGVLENLGAGAYQGVGDVGASMIRGGDWLASKALGFSPYERVHGETPKAAIQRADQRFADERGDSTAASVGRVGGQIAGTIPALALGGGAINAVARAAPALAPAAQFVTGGGGLASRVASGAIQGGTAAGLASGGSENPLVDVAAGAALGGAVPLAWAGAKQAGRGISRAIAPTTRITPETVTLARKAAEEGIDINAAQLTDSPWLRVVDSTTRKVPFSGASKELAKQQTQFNRAVAKRIGVDSDKITPEVYAAAKARIGGEFERLSGKNSLPFTKDLMSEMISVSDDAAKFASDDTARAVKSAIEELTGKTQSGIIPGKAYQALDSKLGKLMKSGGEKAFYLGQLRDALRGAMDDAIVPDDKAAWKLARSQYRNLKTIRDLVAKDSVDGNINPAQLLGRITSTGSGKEAMASNRAGDLTDLAKIGQRFLKDTVPNSGTAERSLYYNALAGTGTAMNPVMGGGALATANLTRRLMNSDAYKQMLLARALDSYAPATAAKPASNTLVKGLAPYASPAAVLAVSEALRKTP